MTFNDDANIKGGRVSKRGRNTGIALGGGGLGLVAIIIIGNLLGVDLSGIVDTSGGTGGGTSGGDTPLTQCDTGEDANANVECRMQAAATSLDAYWSGQLDGYTQPELVLFTGSTNTGCGGATSAVGPFYCPPDTTVYLDTDFYETLRTQFGSSGGPLAQLYVVAHEWGHHIQNITGLMNNLDLQDTGPTSDSVRLELQADCFAGAWAGAASSTTDASGTPFLEPITEAQITDALSAAAAVGDDSIQEATTGQVQPETFTHGSSDQRQRWFLVGFKQGPTECDTFGATTL
jgi:predicted metalloprotease